ncbi:spore coat protein [Anaerobacillus arseniciselenatis]|uniref:Spore coat protein n=1 Tax=Anaerobacillus arseniciselenatis TaxID=85682 RepID=A0A1S2LRU9_9BACI|nr:spore coat protein [Anaerobacillus arseniciselenatis]OIJ15238.1 spore coat protein [Anaerobacillus arseniciselenatis]
MNQMNQMGNGQMAQLTDQVIATDLLMSAKTGVRNCALAITETATPEVRNTLREQLNQAIDFHSQVASYMVAKGYYHPENIQEQINVDVQAAEQAKNLAQQQPPTQQQLQ